VSNDGKKFLVGMVMVDCNKSEEEEEARPPPLPLLGAGLFLAAHKDMVTEFMQKEVQGHQTVEVHHQHSLNSDSSFLCAYACVHCTHLHLCFTGGSASQDASL
jgi:hypothetical protein